MKVFTAAVATILAASALAQAPSSFQNYGLTGVTLTQTGSAYTLGLLPGATVDLGSGPVAIRDVFGFYLAADSGSFTTATSQSAPSQWGFNAPKGNRRITGWDDNGKKNALVPGGSNTYTFGTLSTTVGAQTFTGIHLRVNDGNTYFVRAAPVPEPASLAVLGVGLAALRRRRNHKA